MFSRPSSLPPMFLPSMGTVLLLSAVAAAPALIADDEFSDIRIIRTLPKTTGELDRLHRDSSGNTCEPIAEGQSLDSSNIASVRTDSRGRPSRPAARQSVLSVGLIMDAGDRAELPVASRGKILDYMEEHYVSIQVRVRRDLLNDKLYFHHRPLAATAQYRGSKVTRPFEKLVSTAVREFRSVGLFSQSRDERKPEDLRTLVLLFKNTVLKSGSRTIDQYEYAFVRGRQGSREDRLDTHVFVTSNDRTQLVYLNPYARPMRPEDCSIRGAIAITDYDGTGIIPRESATRSYRLNARRIFPMENIDAYCQKNNLSGGIYEHLDVVLDVLIDQMTGKKAVASGS